MQFKLLENSSPFNATIKNMIKKEKEESHNSYTKNVSSFVGLLQQSENRHLLLLLENGALFRKTNVNSMKFKYLVVFMRSYGHFRFVSFDNEDRSKYVALPFM